MTRRDSARAGVERLLRDKALAGSDRPFSFDQPVGGKGIGLDSLALVAFVIAFEKEFQVEVPETIWSRLPEITPEYFVGILEQKEIAGANMKKGVLDRLAGGASRLFRRKPT